MEFAEKLRFSRKLWGTVSSQVTCYPAPDLTLTHLRSDGKKFEKLSFFDFFRILHGFTKLNIYLNKLIHFNFYARLTIDWYNYTPPRKGEI